MTMRRVRPNSLEAYWSGEESLFNKRELLVLGALRRWGPMTDREIMMRLNQVDPNYCRPRISDLIEDGVLIEAGEKVCPITGKTVRIVRLRSDPRGAGVQCCFDLGKALEPFLDRFAKTS
jgi:hypothetical protein